MTDDTAVPAGQQPGGEPHRAQAIVVMGVSGSGKSTLGRLLAERLGCTFIEGDELHCPSSIEKMRGGTPLSDEDRWPWLDRLGKALHEAAARDGLVVAACSALKYRYRERLGAATNEPIAFVLLEAERTELSRRLDARENHYMPASLLASQLDALERPTDTERALILDSGKPPEALCRATREWLGI
jgi:gluconokinase